MDKPLSLLKKNYLRPPVKGKEFITLFDYAWKNGIGNKISETGDSVSWTSKQLEHAFMDIKKNVSLRSIENWQSGRPPRPKNIHALARIFGGDDKELTVQWREALFESIKLSKSRKTSSSDVPNKPDPGNIQNQVGPEKSIRNKLILSALFGSALSALLLYSILALTGNLESHKHPIAENIKFCSETQFDTFNLICLVNATEFPSDTSMIYVSFELSNAFEGQEFQRAWFRNGEKFLSRKTYNHKAWQGYTYINNPNGHAPGRYVMEVSIGEQSSAGHFTVGNPE